MTRNTKIALGCGGAGCLGIILLVVLCAVLIVAGVIKAPGIYSPNRNSNDNYNYNSNSNYNANSSDNANDNTSSSSDSSSMSDDDKHKLYQAAAATQDHALTLRVWRKLGLVDANGSPTDEYSTFAKDHIAWVFKNHSWLSTVDTPEKARAYVDEHFEE
jgi:hypothetical protein